APHLPIPHEPPMRRAETDAVSVVGTEPLSVPCLGFRGPEQNVSGRFWFVPGHTAGNPGEFITRKRLLTTEPHGVLESEQDFGGVGPVPSEHPRETCQP